MAPHSRRNGKAGTRERLLSAAEEVFAGKGFEGARVEEIASLAGVNIRMLYHHFGSKEGLFLQVVDGIHGEIRARQDALFQAGADTRAFLFRAVEDLFTFLQARPTFVRILGWLTLMGGRHGLLPRVGRDYALQVVRPRIEELARKGPWNPAVDPLFAIMMCWSLALFWFLNREEFHSMTGEGTPLEKDQAYLKQVLALLEGGLLGNTGGKGEM